MFIDRAGFAQIRAIFAYLSDRFAVLIRWAVVRKLASVTAFTITAGDITDLVNGTFVIVSAYKPDA